MHITFNDNRTGSRMLYDLKQALHRWRFYCAARNILDSAPVEGNERDVRVLSSVCHRDLYMYLVAVKTFFRYVPHGRVIILDDGTLTKKDIAILRHQVDPVDITRLDDVPYRAGRKGIRWGILLKMAEIAENYYVVQLDSDTITVDHLPEVEAAINQNHSFTLGTDMGTKIEPVSSTVNSMMGNTSQHVQVVAERNFDKLPGYPDLRYVRGNSGLVGLGKSALSRTAAETFLENMTAAIGAKWYERGSFQVSSNFAIANAPASFVLPLDRYRYYSPYHEMSEARFVHYIGTYRFVDSAYFEAAREAAKLLRTLCPGEKKH